MQKGLPGGVKVRTFKGGILHVQVNPAVHKRLMKDSKKHGDTPAHAIARMMEESIADGMKLIENTTRSQFLQMGLLSVPFTYRERKDMLRRIESLPVIASGKLSLEGFAMLSLTKGLAKLEATGGIEFPFAPRIAPPKLAERYAELDRVMELSPGHGFAESVLGDLLEQMMDGQDGNLESGWTFDNPEECKRTYCKLINKWRKEDGKPHLSVREIAGRNPWPQAPQKGGAA